MPGDGVQSVSTGYQTTCAVARNKVYCWGKGFVGGVFNSPQLVSASTINGKSITKVSVGFDHACVLADAEVYCWGNNQVGQLGDGTTSNRTSPVEVKQDGVLKSKEIMDIATGDGFTCALASDSTTACWGDRTNGRIGDGGSTSGKELNPKAIYVAGALANKKAISLARAGNATMCVIAASSSNNSPTSGSAYCWGFGIDDGSNLPSSGTKTACLASPPVSTTTYLSSNRPVLIPDVSTVSITGQIGDTDTTGIPTTGYMSAVSTNSRAYYWGRYGYTVSYTQGSACGGTPATPTPTPTPPPPPPPTPTCSTNYWAGSPSLINMVGGNLNPDPESSTTGRGSAGSAGPRASLDTTNSSTVILASINNNNSHNPNGTTTKVNDTPGQKADGSIVSGGGGNDNNNNGPTIVPVGKIYLMDCTGHHVACTISGITGGIVGLLGGNTTGVVYKDVYQGAAISTSPSPTLPGSGGGTGGSARGGGAAATPSAGSAGSTGGTGGSARGATPAPGQYSYYVGASSCAASTTVPASLGNLFGLLWSLSVDKAAALSNPDATTAFATDSEPASVRLAASEQGYYYTSTVTTIGKNAMTAPPTYPSTSGGIRLLTGNAYEGNNGGLVCIVWSSNGTYCDGHGTSTLQGQLGNGSSAQQSGAKQVYDAAKTSGITSISTATNYTCAVISGYLECWGQNSNGQLGVGNSQNQNKPTRVTSWP